MRKPEDKENLSTIRRNNSEAHKTIVFSYLREDIGNCASQKIQVPESCALTNPAPHKWVSFYLSDILLS